MCGNGNLQAPAHFLSFPNGNTRNAPDSFPLPLCKNSADKVLHTENDLLTKKKELESKIATKEEEIRTLKARLSNIVRQHEFATPPIEGIYSMVWQIMKKDGTPAFPKNRKLEVLLNLI